MDVENPLQIEYVYPEIIPVANIVSSIEVDGEPFIEPKRENKISVIDIIKISICVLLLLSLIGGFLYFIIWIYGQPAFD